MKKVLVVLSVLSAIVLVGCTPPPPQPPITSTPMINIYVKLSAFSNAQNLYEAAGGITNAIYGVGDFGGLKNNAGVVIPVWTPGSTAAQLAPAAGMANIWVLSLPNTLTNNASLGFKFVNGTPGFGGTYACEELEMMDDGSTTEGIANRTLNILKGFATNIWMTNDVVTNVGGTAMGCITVWKAVGGTYACTNVTVTVVLKDVVTNDTFGGNPCVVDQGTNVNLFGSFNGWAGTITNAAVDVNGNATFTFVYVSGAATVDYQGRATTGANTFYYSAIGGGNFSLTIPAAQATSGTVVVTNKGAWKN